MAQSRSMSSYFNFQSFRSLSSRSNVGGEKKSVEQMDFVAPTAEADDDILTQVQQEEWYKVSSKRHLLLVVYFVLFCAC